MCQFTKINVTHVGNMLLIYKLKNILWTLIKWQMLHFSLAFCYHSQRYHDVSLYNCKAIYSLSQNIRSIVILSVSWVESRIETYREVPWFPHLVLTQTGIHPYWWPWFVLVLVHLNQKLKPCYRKMRRLQISYFVRSSNTRLRHYHKISTFP